MPPQVAIPAEHLAAGGAVVRFDVRVREKMGLQVASLVETPCAHGTFVRRFLHVQDLVHGQGPALTESFSTLGAFERFFLAVDVPATDRSIFPLSIIELAEDNLIISRNWRKSV